MIQSITVYSLIYWEMFWEKDLPKVTQQLKVVPPPGRDDNRVSKLQVAKSNLLPVFAKLCWNTACSFTFVLSLAAFTL